MQINPQTKGKALQDYHSVLQHDLKGVGATKTVKNMTILEVLYSNM